MTFNIGQPVVVVTEIEVDGFHDDDPEQPYTCILREGDVVEIVGTPTDSLDMNSGDKQAMIEVRATDTVGVERTPPIDVVDLEPIPTS